MRILSMSLLALTLVAGCSDQSQDKGKGQPASATPAAATPVKDTPPPSLKVVLDTFEVGNNVYVRSIMADPDKQALWIGTSVGVHEIDLTTQQPRQTITREQGLANEYVFAIGKDAEGAVWFGTNAGGASRLKEGKWKTYFPMHGLADYWVYSFASHPDGGLWIGTWAGVNRLDLKTGRMDTYVKELINEWVYALNIDAKQRVWFGTEGGVSRFDGKEWKSWTHETGLGSSNASKLPASDNTGLGTRRRHDLGVLSGGAPTYNPNYVFSMVITPEQTVWAGTWGGGVSRFDEASNRWTSFNTNDGLPGNIVYSMVQDQDGVIWAGTDNGLGIYRQGKWTSFEQNVSLLGENIYTLAATPAGEIWAGARGKVFRIGKPVSPK